MGSPLRTASKATVPPPLKGSATTKRSRRNSFFAASSSAPAKQWGRRAHHRYSEITGAYAERLRCCIVTRRSSALQLTWSISAMGGHHCKMCILSRRSGQCYEHHTLRNECSDQAHRRRDRLRPWRHREAAWPLPARIGNPGWCWRKWQTAVPCPTFLRIRGWFQNPPLMENFAQASPPQSARGP
jgi:hypothetical protein